MGGIEELEEHCGEIQGKLNKHGSTIKHVFKDFSESDTEYAENENLFLIIKKRITKAIDELTEEKGRLSNLKNDASKLSSDLMTAELELSKEVNDLEGRSDYLWRQIKTANREYEESQSEMREASQKLNEAKKILAEAVEERERRNSFNPFTFIVKVTSGFIVGMALFALMDLINKKKDEIEQLERNTEHLQRIYNKLRETQNELESNKRDLERRQRNIKNELNSTKENLEKAENLLINTIKMEKIIVKWTAMLQELYEKIKKVEKHRGMISKKMFGRQEEAIKCEIEQIVTDARQIYENERFRITLRDEDKSLVKLFSFITSSYKN